MNHSAYSFLQLLWRDWITYQIQFLLNLLHSKYVVLWFYVKLGWLSYCQCGEVIQKICTKGNNRSLKKDQDFLEKRYLKYKFLFYYMSLNNNMILLKNIFLQTFHFNWLYVNLPPTLSACALYKSDTTKLQFSIKKIMYHNWSVIFLFLVEIKGGGITDFNDQFHLL